jgi:hypothetical protein
LIPALIPALAGQRIAMPLAGQPAIGVSVENGHRLGHDGFAAGLCGSGRNL